MYGEGGLVDVMSALYPDYDDDDDLQEQIQEQLEEDGDCDYNDEEVRKLSDETDWSKTWNELEWNKDKQRVSSIIGSFLSQMNFRRQRKKTKYNSMFLKIGCRTICY